MTVNASLADLAFSTVNSINAIGQDEWDACLADTPGGNGYPFLRHRYLAILERCGAIDGKEWRAHYVTVRDPSGRLVGAIPLFLKNSGFADFMDEAEWKQTLEGMGGRYFPKLQVCAPFAPNNGPRLLLRHGAPEGLAPLMVRILADTARSGGFSGIHATFLTAPEATLFRQDGWHLRSGFLQLHWRNQGYASFDDFLGTMVSRKRSMIREERGKVAATGVEIQVLTGADLREEHMDAFASLYRLTFAKKGVREHLPRDYFLMMGQEMADNIVLIAARDGRNWVGAALHFQGGGMLYTRSWGGELGHSLLHFEATYYRAIEYAIERGLTRIDGGLGGEYKLKRGYQPVHSVSAHLLTNPALDNAVGRFLEGERVAAALYLEGLAGDLPYRADSRPSAPA